MPYFPCPVAGRAVKPDPWDMRRPAAGHVPVGDAERADEFRGRFDRGAVWRRRDALL